MKHLKSFNEAKRSTALDRGEGYISTGKSQEIYNIVDDCLVHSSDDGYNITRSLQDPDVMTDSEQELLGMELFVRLYRYGEHFSLNDVVDNLNNLISHLDSIYIDLKSVKYWIGSESFNTKGHWFDLSMDPVNGEIMGNRILCMKDNSGRDVSDIRSLISIELIFV